MVLVQSLLRILWGVVVQMDDKMAMNVPGVYAIGDIQNTPYKQVVIAALDGCRQSNYKYSNRSNV